MKSEDDVEFAPDMPVRCELLLHLHFHTFLHTSVRIWSSSDGGGGAGSVQASPSLSKSVPVCPSLPQSVPVCPSLSQSVPVRPVCPGLSKSAPVCPSPSQSFSETSTFRSSQHLFLGGPSIAGTETGHKGLQPRPPIVVFGSQGGTLLPKRGADVARTLPARCPHIAQMGCRRCPQLQNKPHLGIRQHVDGVRTIGIRQIVVSMGSPLLFSESGRASLSQSVPVCPGPPQFATVCPSLSWSVLVCPSLS